MTVKELIDRLSKLDPDDEVRIAQPTHCYWRRTMAVEISQVNHQLVEHSDYYEGDILRGDEDDEEEDDEMVVLIR